MNRTTLVVVGGVVAGLAVGVVSSSRVAGAQARGAGARQQEAQCHWSVVSDEPTRVPTELNAWLAARGREGFALAQTASGNGTALVCVTRPVP